MVMYKRVTYASHFPAVVSGFSQAFVTGKFCDVKVVCEDSDLWAHRLVLSGVSPFLRSLLEEFELRGENVITIFLPLIKGYHMKLVLDYIYSGAMYLWGAHMQYVIQVMEVLQLSCGVSVSKMVLNNEADTTGNHWVEIEQTSVKLQQFHSEKEKIEKEEEAKIEDCNEKRVEGKLKPEDAGDLNKENSDDANVVKNSESQPTSNDANKDKDPTSDEEVLVELDEEFVVEIRDSHDSGEEDVVDDVGAPTGHKCILCGRVFGHYENLQVHLKGHIGVNVHLNRCDICKKNFRNKTECNLHALSHKYARALGKRLTSKPVKSIITTTGSQVKKIVRKYLKDKRVLGSAPRVEKPDEREDITPVNGEDTMVNGDNNMVSGGRLSQDALTCPICEKSYGVKSLYLRHVKQKHQQLASQLGQRVMLQRTPFVKIKNVHLPHMGRKSPGGSPANSRTSNSTSRFTPS